MGGEETQLSWRAQDNSNGCKGLAEEGATRHLPAGAAVHNSSVSTGHHFCVQAQAYLVAHHQAIKLFRGKAHATLQQRQEAAYRKALTHVHPGTPPIAVEATPRAIPDDDVQVLSRSGSGMYFDSSFCSFRMPPCSVCSV